MNKLKNFFKANKNLIRAILIFFIIIITIIIIRKEIKSIDISQIKILVNTTSSLQKILFVVLGVLSFSFATIYDYILAKYYDMKIPMKEVFKIGFISQSFNNFIGLGGLAGVTTRELLYDKYKLDRKIANRIIFIVLFSDIIGLFTLSLPASIELYTRKYYFIASILLLLFVAVIGFIFIDILPIKKYLKDENSVFIREQRKLRVYLTLQSSFEWLMAAIFFAYTIIYYQPEISLLEASAVYVISTIIAFFSMIPGGLGSFEASAIFVFGLMGYKTPNIFLSLLVCRICYTIVPWIIGVILVLFNSKNDIEEHEYVKKANTTSFYISYVILACGALLVFSALLPTVFLKFKFFQKHLPNIFTIVNFNITLFIGLCLIALSTGIQNRVKLAYRMSLILLSIIFILYMTISKNYYSAFIALVIIILLFTNRQYFTGYAQKISIIKTLIAFIILNLLNIIYMTIYNISHHVDVINGFEKYSLEFMHDHFSEILLIPFLLAAIYAIFLSIERKHISFEGVSEKEKEDFEKFFEDNSYESNTHLFYMYDKNIFLNSKKTVLFLYRPFKGTLFVLGNPCGKKEDFEDAIEELIIFAQKNKMDVFFSGIKGNVIEDFVSQGFELMKIGEDAVVNLDNFSLAGKKYKIMRRSLNYMDTVNYKFEVIYPPFNKDTMNQLKTVSDEWLGKRKEMQFSIGAFKEDYIQKAPVFIIKQDREILAFANMNPVKNTKKMSIDLMRHKNNVFSGIMDMMFISIINWAKENDYKYFDLGLSPLSNVGNSMFASKKEKTAKLAYKYANKIYGFQGLKKFKNKYNPEWNSIFIASQNNIKLLDNLIKLLNMNYKNSNES
ncbi:bifunctional lysylphosphatidylglycerol flippase/synthetase MprF [Helcococcus sueciensis]|uniref:bifunctional lysylphosphatidylglycerol flippase/synthetase MprF n=1 Tax=Helcococcus sueciensis TaxID=241555 RepID=UPI0003FE9560|nr:bifunctional lysylphosphatidylglycerol flippase/synthetase MprF [Helcococcus sueciensis]